MCFTYTSGKFSLFSNITQSLNNNNSSLLLSNMSCVNKCHFSKMRLTLKGTNGSKVLFGVFIPKTHHEFAQAFDAQNNYITVGSE